MMAEIDVYGVFVPGLFLFALVAVPVTMLIQKLLVASHFYRIVWHRSLFDLALFFVVLGAVFAAFTYGQGDTFPVVPALREFLST